MWSAEWARSQERRLCLRHAEGVALFSMFMVIPCILNMHLAGKICLLHQDLYKLVEASEALNHYLAVFKGAQSVPPKVQQT